MFDCIERFGQSMNRRWKLFPKFVLVAGVLFSCIPVGSVAMGDERGAQLLQRALASQCRWDHSTYRVKASVQPSESSHTVSQRTSYWVRRRGQDVDSIGQIDFDGAMVSESARTRAIIADQRFIELSESLDGSVQKPRIAGFSDDIEQYFGRTIGTPQHGGFLEGLCYGRQRLLARLLESGGGTFLRSEEIDGTPCDVVEGEDRYGKVILWIAPELEYCVMKLVLDTTDTDGERYEIRDVRTANSSGAIVPVYAKLVREYGLGKSRAPHETIVYQATREDIDFAPTFSESPTAFVLEMNEGQSITNWDRPESGLGYVWRDGKIRPAEADFQMAVEPRFRYSRWVLLTLVVGILLIVGANQLKNREAPSHV